VSRPCVAWLTDFGTRDHYVGAMKGVALGICADASFVDITHDIDPQHVVGGALELAAAYRYFPAQTVFVVVVDPGVGTSRRAIAAECGEWRFVAPDNGVLSLVLAESPPARVVELREPRYARPSISRTFEGRDRFAPAGAWLASGVDLDALGPRIDTWEMLHVPTPYVDEGVLYGEVLRVDRFGNLITNIDRATLERHAGGHATAVSIGDHPIGAIVRTYSELPAGEPGALFSSTDHLEVAVNGGSAAATLGAARGSLVRCVMV
jgi:S-adenosylmethionine hydrolase